MTPKREDELIEKIARFIVNNNMGDFAEVVLGAYGKADSIGQMGFVQLYPYMSLFFGREGQELIEVLGLNPSVNSRRVLEKVRELEKEKEAQKEMKRILGPEKESDKSKTKAKLSKRLSSFFFPFFEKENSSSAE